MAANSIEEALEVYRNDSDYDFNLVLNDGDKAVIIGEEGNGKSTLMKRTIYFSAPS